MATEPAQLFFVEANTLRVTKRGRSEERREHRLVARLAALAGLESELSDDGIPTRWSANPKFRCINEHVSGQWVAARFDTKRCIFCRANLFLTFPEDHSGPWALDLAGWTSHSRSPGSTARQDFLAFIPDQRFSSAEPQMLEPQSVSPLLEPLQPAGADEDSTIPATVAPEPDAIEDVDAVEDVEATADVEPIVVTAESDRPGRAVTQPPLHPVAIKPPGSTSRPQGKTK